MIMLSASGCELERSVCITSHWFSASGPDLMRVVKEGNGREKGPKASLPFFGELLCISLC